MSPHARYCPFGDQHNLLSAVSRFSENNGTWNLTKVTLLKVMKFTQHCVTNLVHCNLHNTIILHLVTVVHYYRCDWWTKWSRNGLIRTHRTRVGTSRDFLNYIQYLRLCFSYPHSHLKFLNVHGNHFHIPSRCPKLSLRKTIPQHTAHICKPWLTSVSVLMFQKSSLPSPSALAKTAGWTGLHWTS